MTRDGENENVLEKPVEVTTSQLKRTKQAGSLITKKKKLEHDKET